MQNSGETFSKNRSGLGLDHEVSLVPQQFKKMVDELREIEAGLFQNFEKSGSSRTEIFRSIHLSRMKEKGSVLSRNDVKLVRPNIGLHPRELAKIEGKTLKRTVLANEPLRYEDVEW